MCTIYISICHYYYFMISHFFNIEIITYTCSKSSYHIFYHFTVKDILSNLAFSTFRILPLKRQNCLITFYLFPALQNHPQNLPQLYIFHLKQDPFLNNLLVFQEDYVLSNTFFLLVSSLAFFAASLALAAVSALSILFLH